MIGSKKNIRNACMLFILFFFLITGEKVYSQPGRRSHPQSYSHSHSVLNWGVQAGFNALSVNFYEIEGGGVFESSKESYKNRVGYNLTAFARINLGRLFMQPEFSWNLYRQDLSFTLSDTIDLGFIPTSISVKSQVASSNVLVGYNIVKNGPFVLNAFIGPSFKYIYRINYHINNLEYTIKKSNFNEPHYKYSGVMGMSISISKVHFDIRYEINQPDTDIHLNEIPDIPEQFENVYIHKNENILNFSFGVMF